MSANTERLARFDTCRAIQTDEHSEQIDLRAIGVREHGQRPFDELTAPRDAQTGKESGSTSDRSSRSDFEAERDRLKREVNAEAGQ